MTEPADPSHERLKQHFAQRVTHQARQILETWQRLQRRGLSVADLGEMREAALRLQRYAERFEQPEHRRLAVDIGQTLQLMHANGPRLAPEPVAELNGLMERLSCTGLRKGDQLDQVPLPPLRKPVYILLHEHERAIRLAQQLEFFGLDAQALCSAEAFGASMSERLPSAIVMDVDFCGPGRGLQLATEARSRHEQHIPLLFFSLHDTDTPTHRRAWPQSAPEVMNFSLALWKPQACWRSWSCWAMPLSPTLCAC